MLSRLFVTAEINIVAFDIYARIDCQPLPGETIRRLEPGRLDIAQHWPSRVSPLVSDLNSSVYLTGRSHRPETYLSLFLHYRPA
jgi:hypothetical protein